MLINIVKQLLYFFAKKEKRKKGKNLKSFKFLLYFKCDKKIQNEIL